LTTGLYREKNTRTAIGWGNEEKWVKRKTQLLGSTGSITRESPGQREGGWVFQNKNACETHEGERKSGKREKRKGGRQPNWGSFWGSST